MPTSDIHHQLAALATEEASLLQSKSEAIKQARRQVERDLERAGESLRRALPELDVVSRTCTDLRSAIQKTMDRADVVSSRVRELDQSRSRALRALDYTTRKSEVQQCLDGAAKALEDRDLQQAAEYVRRFDAAKADEDETKMVSLRHELERLVGEQLDGMWDGLDEACAQADWADSEVARAALEHAAVMSKLGAANTLATQRYTAFVASQFKSRCEFELVPLRALAETARAPADDSPVFLNALKSVLNAAAVIIDKHGLNSPACNALGAGLSGLVLQAVHRECDAQMQALFDVFLSSRRLHERAGGPLDSLERLNVCLVELCLLMQRVESYDRFVRARAASFGLGVLSEKPDEYRRLVHELAGVYSLLEKSWIGESLQRAVRADKLVALVLESRALTGHSLTEDAFYVAKAAIKRGLATGLCDAACACTNLATGALEDCLLLSQPRPPPSFALVNSLEQACDYASGLHKFIVQSDALERPEDKNKLQSCADGLLDLRSKLETARDEVCMQVFNSTLRQGLKSVLTEAEGLSYAQEGEQPSSSGGDDGFAARVVSSLALVLSERLLPQLGIKGGDVLVALAGHMVAEEVEKAIVQKRFSAFGGIKFDRDVRVLVSGISALAPGNPLLCKAVFHRLGQMGLLLSVGSIEEVHDVWDVARQGGEPRQCAVVRPKDGLSGKEAKRVLGLRLDFEAKAVSEIKL